MNVLILTAHYHPNLGGVETHLLDLTKGLIERNHWVFVLTYQPLTTDVSGKIIERSKHLMILRIPYLRGLFYKLVSYPLLEFVYLLPGLFIVTPSLLLTKKIDVIHAHGIVAGFVGVVWARIFQKRVVISLHSVYHFPQKGIYSWFVKQIFSWSDKVICLSKQSQKELIEIGVNDEKTGIFTYWINQKIFKPLRKTDLKSYDDWKDFFVVLFTGRFIQEKGVLELLKSVPLLSEKILIVFAGEGPLRDAIAEKTGRNVILLGRLSQNELSKALNAADCLIVPSVHEEGFGRVILEALSCGTAVIAANRGGIKEAMNESVGRLIPISPQSIAKTINSLYTNQKLLQGLSRNAVSYARERYAERNINQILESYEK